MGFLLGGGLSHLSNQHGFGSDNVVSFELVLANTTTSIVYVLKSETNNYSVLVAYHATRPDKVY